MKALGKAESTEKSGRTDELRAAAEKLTAVIEAFNLLVEGARAPVECALEAYNAVLSDARDFCEGIAADQQSFMEEKSEKWQEGDRGQAFQSWLDEWSGVELSDVEIEFPDGVEEPDLPHADAIEGLPDEPA